MESKITTIGISKDQILSILLEYSNSNNSFVSLFQKKRFNDRIASSLYEILRHCENESFPLSQFFSEIESNLIEFFSEDNHNDVFPVSLIDAAYRTIFQPEDIFLNNFEYHKNGIFRHKAKSIYVTRLWFRKMDNKWEWTPYDPFVKNENSIWISVSSLKVPIGKFAGEKPATININFINWLNKWNPEKPLKYINPDDYQLNSVIKVLDIITPDNQEVQAKTENQTSKHIIDEVTCNG